MGRVIPREGIERSVIIYVREPSSARHVIPREGIESSVSSFIRTGPSGTIFL